MKRTKGCGFSSGVKAHSRDGKHRSSWFSLQLSRGIGNTPIVDATGMESESDTAMLDDSAHAKVWA